MGLLYAFGAVSGFTLEDAHFIGARWDPAVEGAADQIITRAHAGGYESLISIQSCSDLWRSPTGAVYVAAGTGVEWTAAGVYGAAPWQRFECSASGVWGFDDQHVFAFPRGLSTNYGHRFDGVSWSRFDAPGVVHRMHGRDADALVAVGSPGLIAHRSGGAWRVQPTDVRGVFLDVHVASDDEIYAVHDSGQLWEGSMYGWSVRLEAEPRTLRCVAKWRDRVWVGTTDQGLCVLDGTRLVPIKPNLRPTRMDSRGDLLLSQSEMIVGTADGESFRAIKTPTLETLFAPIKPRWIP